MRLDAPGLLPGRRRSESQAARRACTGTSACVAWRVEASGWEASSSRCLGCVPAGKPAAGFLHISFDIVCHMAPLYKRGAAGLSGCLGAMD